MVKQLTVQGFFKTFPDDDACLDHLMQLRFGDELECPKCKKNGHFTKIKKNPRLLLSLVRSSHSPQARNTLRAVPHVPTKVVLCDLSVRGFPPRRSGEGTTAPVRRDL